jgi:hypothetical protein
MTNFNKYDLKYLNKKPKRIFWEKIAGDRYLEPTERYDVVFDDYDLKIRGLIK